MTHCTHFRNQGIQLNYYLAKQVIYMAQNILLGNIHFHLSNKMNPCLQGKKLFYGADWYYFHMLHLLQISCHLWLNIQFYNEKDNPTNKYRHNHQFLQYIPYFELINTVCYSLENYQNYYCYLAKIQIVIEGEILVSLVSIPYSYP